MHTPLDIKNTPNCQPHPWHPSVMYFSNGWNGHRFWMAQTPFPPDDVPPYRDRHELPCIHFSDDGLAWVPIEGNPIDDISTEMVESHNYLSDPHLVFRDGIMECYYRLTLLKDKQLIDNQTLLLRKRSFDGVHWSSREIVADLQKPEDEAIWGTQIISPAIRWDGQQYQCWYIDSSVYVKGRKILMTTSADGIVWHKHSVCSLTCPFYIDPWHIDVQYYDGLYQLIVYDDWQLYWFDSADGINFRFVSNILTPSQYFVDFYSEGLYRTCSVKVDDIIRVYFSAKNAHQSFLGLFQTKDRIHFSAINGVPQLYYIAKYVIPQFSRKNAKRFVKHELRRMKLMQ